MSKQAKWISILLAVVAGPVSTQAANRAPIRSVRYAPAPSWVVAPPKGSEAPTPPGAPLRIVYADQQVRVTERGQKEFQATRMALLAPEALAAGNYALTWSPASEEMVVHKLSIVRNGQVIDVLATQKFAIIQRENSLEQSALDGDLTATLQVGGLQVGDELELALTKVRHETSLGERPQGFIQFPVAGVRGAYRVRLIAHKGSEVGYRVSSDLPQPIARDLGSETER